mmetsp:Transcript_51047/g.101580  ORF Transcript_51047/g.101580 Transcript_51047/m.101580 type:complete len:85 (+) Transcript_51047:473-727(+)
MIAAFKAEGDKLSLSRCTQLCFGPAKFEALYKEKGITLFLCKAIVNAGHSPMKDFFWLEFSTSNTYKPRDHLHMQPGGTAGCWV